MSRIVKELKATRNVAGGSEPSRADTKTTEDYIAILKVKLTEQKKELENRTDAINAVQRNFESLSDIYSDERGRVERSHKNVTELEQKNNILVRELQQLESIKLELHKQTQEFSDFKTQSATTQSDLQRVISTSTETIHDLQSQYNKTSQKNRSLLQYKEDIINCTQLVYELENVSKTLSNGTKLMYHSVGKKSPLLTSLRRDTNDEKELDEALPLSSRMIALKDGLQSVCGSVENFNAVTHDLIEEKNTADSKIKKNESRISLLLSDQEGFQCEIEKLQSQLRSQQLQGSKTQTDLSNSVRSMSSIVDNKDHEITNLISELHSIKSTVKEISNTTTTSSPTGCADQLKSISNFISSTSTATELIRLCLHKNSLSTPTCSDMREYANVMITEFDNVVADRFMIKCNLESTISELRNLNETCSDIIAERTRLEDLLVSKDENICTIRQQLALLSNSRETLQHKIEELEKSNSNQLAANSNASDSLRNARLEMTTLKDKISSLEMQQKTDHVNISNSLSKNKQMHLSIEELKAASTEELLKAKTANSDLLSQLSTLRESQHHHQSLQQDYTVAVENLRIAEERIKSILVDKTSIESRLERELENSQNQLNKISSYAGEKQRELSDDIKQKNSKISKLETENQKLLKELEVVKKNEDLMRKLESQEKQNEILSKTVSDMKLRDTEVTACLSELQLVQSETQIAIKKLLAAEEASESCMSCSSCLEIMSDPTICHPCGHVFCSSCIQQKKPKESTHWCPECSEYSVERTTSMRFMNELVGRFTYRKQVLSDLQSALDVAVVRRHSLIEHNSLEIPKS